MYETPIILTLCKHTIGRNLMSIDSREILHIATTFVK